MTIEFMAKMLTHLLLIVIAFEGLLSCEYRLRNRKTQFNSRRRSSPSGKLMTTTMEENGVVPDVIDKVPRQVIQVIVNYTKSYL